MKILVSASELATLRECWADLPDAFILALCLMVGAWAIGEWLGRIG